MCFGHAFNTQTGGCNAIAVSLSATADPQCQLKVSAWSLLRSFLDMSTALGLYTVLCMCMAF